MSDSGPEERRPITASDVEHAEKLAGVEFTDAQRRLLLKRAQRQLAAFEGVRRLELPSQVAPALHFDPRPPAAPHTPAPFPVSRLPAAERPGVGEEDLPFAGVGTLAVMLRRGEISSLELTRLALERLKGVGRRLRAVVTVTEELALEQAVRADRELREGTDRGVLHGIPYGAKDLLAVAGYPTTWGAAPYREQRFNSSAAVIERLERAGAVLTAKLSLGELAMGDVWFGGLTLSPWTGRTGSSGSSAGSAAAVAAGLVPFAIGTETMGSIVSPATRCGIVGLRPSPGLVPRTGAMPLAWSLDKIGPMTRSVEDAALVLQAIAGPDGRDHSAVDFGFEWQPRQDVRRLRVGIVEEAFGTPATVPRAQFDRQRLVLDGLRRRGVELLPVSLPRMDADTIMNVLLVEAAAAFDELTRSGRDAELVQQGEESWPNLLRAARLVPAVEYVQANRARQIAVRETAALFGEVDAYLCTSAHSANSYLTNATGNPQVVVPLGLGEDGEPLRSSITVTGPLHGEQEALAVAGLVEEVVSEVRGGARPRPALS